MHKQKLRDVLDSKFLSIQPAKTQVTLVELDNIKKPHTLQHVDVLNLPADTLVINYQHLAEPNFISLAPPAAHYRKKTDYTIITEIDHKGYVFHIEMKSSSLPYDAIYQLCRSRALIAYLNNAIQNLDDIVPAFDKYEHRYVILWKPKLEKGLTTIKEVVATNFPTKYPNTEPKHAHPFDMNTPKIDIRDFIYNGE